ncbi:MAG: alpha-amylase family glycosyl hydrolase [Rhodothermales bacterium]
MLLRWSVLLTAFVLAGPVKAQEYPFSWDHATVYQIVTDRFSNGDSSNDFAYGRGLDGEGNEYAEDAAGHFSGGDYQGILGWIEDGYFTDLGVNTLWLSAPYEQVHGWVGGGDGDFQLYGYDASWPFDYTEFESAFGEAEDFALLTQTARERGMRVIVDVDLNHVGPATMHDMAAFGFGGLTGEGWRTWQPSSRVGWQSYLADLVTVEDAAEGWQHWWGRDWVRADIVGYEACGDDPATQCAGGLPDIRSDIEVDSLPPFLSLKWGEDKTIAEQAELDAFFGRTGAPRTAANHVVKWLADWVAEQDIDGFHLREADGLDPVVTGFLIQEVSRAYRMRLANPEASFLLLASEEAPIEIPIGSGVEWRLLNDHESNGPLPEATEATVLANNSNVRGLPFRALSVGFSGDDPDQVSSFLLQPGPIVLTYGAESGRMPGEEISDARHMAMSPMNWTSFNEEQLALWTAIGSFRGAHPAIARGGYDPVQDDPKTFHRGVRIGMDADQVMIATGAEGRTRLNVSIVWPDDTVLRDAMTGNVGFVSFGQVSMTPHPSGLLLLEVLPE